MKECIHGHGIFEGRFCKTCHRIAVNKWRSKNRWRYEAKYKKTRTVWLLKNKTRVSTKHKLWVQANRERLRTYKKSYLASNPQAAMAKRARDRITKILIRYDLTKQDRTETLLGCSWRQLIEYIESKFLPGMNWGNRSRWHIDHIKPLSKFDLTDISQLKKAVHYTNLQPLWAKVNHAKKDKFPYILERAA